MPWPQLGAKPGVDYKGDGLAVNPSPKGAGLRCVFQRLEGEATTEGLWLSSTVTNTVNGRFRIVASAVGRELKGVARGSVELASARPSSNATRSNVPSVPAAGTVSIEGETVHFIRPGLVEDYSVSMDGVRQDFVMLERPTGAGELAVRLAVSGARVEQVGSDVQLVLENSGRKIAYKRLRVTDATGKELPARMEVRPTEDEVIGLSSQLAIENQKSETKNQNCFLTPAPTIVVLVDDAQAVYPVRIDPTFSDANWVVINPTGTDPWVYNSLVDSAGNLYICGQFTMVGGVAANYIAKWDGTAWSSLGSGMYGTTYTFVGAMAFSPGGELYAAGRFTKAGGVAANCIARWDGSQWWPLGTGASGFQDAYVYALLFSGTDLYVGGDFTVAGGNPANNIAKWDGAWSALGSGTGLDGAVFVLRDWGGSLYAGGRFASADGDPSAGYLARWDGNRWYSLGIGLSGSNYPNDPYAGTYALLVSGSGLYVGGDFTFAGGNPANYIAKWDGSSWSAVGSGMDNSVLSLVLLGNEICAGGWFTTADGKPANHVAKWDGSSWKQIGSGTDGDIFTLAVSGNSLFAGGRFVMAGDVVANFIAKWNGTAWSALGSQMTRPVSALALSGNDLYAGGEFTTALGSVGNHVARWNGSTWSPVGTGMNNSVYALTLLNGNLYAGGRFTIAGGNPANRIAKWNGSGWSPLGTGMEEYVSALAVSGSQLYAGGAFTNAGGNIVNHIAKWDGSHWRALGSGMNGLVSAIAVLGTDVYAGGAFTVAGGITANSVAKWNGTSWSALGSGMIGPVNALTVWNGELYAGGDFTTASGRPANYIARWDGTFWKNVGSGMDKPVAALASSGNVLFAGGWFYQADWHSVFSIAAWDGTAWFSLGSGMIDSPVRALVASPSDLFAGGDFVGAGWKPSAFAARFILDYQQPASCCLPASGAKFVQYPDLLNPINMDASFTPQDPFDFTGWVLADDFLCTNTGPITDITLWGSYNKDVVDPNARYTLSIWSDASVAYPGALLWHRTYAPGEYIRCVYTNLQQNVYTPSLNSLDEATNLYQICFPTDPANAFTQNGTVANPTNYWLSVAVESVAVPESFFAWKSSRYPYRNSAVGAGFSTLYPAPGDWFSLQFQQEPVNLAFAINTATNSCPAPVIQCSNRVIQCGTGWVPVPPPVVDQCCPPGPATLAAAFTNGAGCSQVITLDWQYTDCLLRTAYCTQLVSFVKAPLPICCSTESAFTVKYTQTPDLIKGIDVDATFSPPEPINSTGWVLADDFLCTNTGPVTDIILWGSWQRDSMDPDAIYTLSIWSDAPATPANAYNHPDQLLWSQTYGRGQFNRCTFTNLLEGFYTPTLDQMDWSTNLYQLCFHADTANTFYQTGTPTVPTNYWLAVTVQSTFVSNWFGWKSSDIAYNGSAVGAGFSPLYPSPGDWYPLSDLQGNALNFAFAVTTHTNFCPFPVIQCSNRVVECGLPWSPVPPSVLDQCCAAPNPVTLASAVTNGTGCSQVITLNWQYTDCLHRTVPCSQLVTFTPPTFSPFCSVTNGVKFVQLPDPINGIDSDTTLNPADPIAGFRWMLADDFRCTNTGPVTEIVLWGSWFNDDVDINASYTLSVWSDVRFPDYGYAGPNELLWTQTYYRGQYSSKVYSGLREGFSFPYFGLTNYSTNLYQICFQANPTNTFVQTGMAAAPTNYWLSVAVQSGGARYFGWKSSASAYNNSAVASPMGMLFPPASYWFDYHDAQGQAVNLAFAVTTATNCPVPPILHSQDRHFDCGTAWKIDPPLVFDSCCPNPGPAILAGTVTNASGCPKVITLDWGYTNCMQQTASCRQQIFVEDATVPVVTCAPDKTIPCQALRTFTFDPPSAYDSCSGTNVSITPLGGPVTNNPPCPLILAQAWAVADPCGNTEYCTQKVTVVDTPLTLSCPADIVVKTCDTNPVQVQWSGSFASLCDNVAGSASSPPSGSSFLPNTTSTVTYWVWTKCLVTNSCTFKVSVVRPELKDLTITYSNGYVTVRWADGILQQANAITGPYTDVPLAAPPTYTVAADKAAAFYRLRCAHP